MKTLKELLDHKAVMEKLLADLEQVAIDGIGVLNPDQVVQKQKHIKELRETNDELKELYPEFWATLDPLTGRPYLPQYDERGVLYPTDPATGKYIIPEPEKTKEQKAAEARTNIDPSTGKPYDPQYNKNAINPATGKPYDQKYDENGVLRSEFNATRNDGSHSDPKVTVPGGKRIPESKSGEPEPKLNYPGGNIETGADIAAKKANAGIAKPNEGTA